MRLGGPDFVFHLPGWGNIEGPGAAVVSGFNTGSIFKRNLHPHGFSVSLDATPSS